MATKKKSTKTSKQGKTPGPATQKPPKNTIGDTSLETVSNVKPQFSGQVDVLEPENLASILKSAETGQDIQPFLELATVMPERDAHYFSLLQSRTLQILATDWVIDGPNDEINDFVRTKLLDTAMLRWAITDMMDAVNKGFAVLQPVWSEDNGPWLFKEFRRVDQRCFRFDQDTGTQLLLRDHKAAQGVRPLPPELIVHYPRLRSEIPIRGGLARIAAAIWAFKTFSIREWQSFLEAYGIPLKIAKYDNFSKDGESLGTATRGQKAALKKALARLAAGTSIVVPKDVEIIIEAARTGDGGTYREFCEYLDQQLSKAVLGATLSTDKGGSYAQAQVHDRMRIAYAQADGASISATVMESMVKPLIRLNFGADAEIPNCYLDITEEEDLQQWSNAVNPFIVNGLKVPAPFVREKLGIPEPEEGDEIIEPRSSTAQAMQQPALNTANPTLTNRLANDTVKDWADIMGPYKSTLDEIALNSKSFDDFLKGLETFADKVDSNPLVAQLAELAMKARMSADLGKADQ